MLKGRCICLRDNEDLRIPPVPTRDSSFAVTVELDSGRVPDLETEPDEATPTPSMLLLLTLAVTPSTVVARDVGRLGGADMFGREN